MVSWPVRGGVRRLLKSGFARLGYRVGRIPPLASDPSHALELDFDYVLADYLMRRDDASPFFFVQVGAFDGITNDRLNEHVRKGRWHGVLVEPQPRYFERLVENYADLEGLRFVNAAVAGERGSRTLYGIHDEHGEPIDSLAGLASFSREHLLWWQRIEGHRSAPRSRIGSTTVSCVTFEDLLAETDHVDLLHVDAEGYDVEILKVFDFRRFLPAVVRFEHAHLSPADWDAAVELLAGHGYRMAQEEFDTTAYRRPETGRHRARGGSLPSVS